MKGPRDQLLAGAGFTVHEHRRRGLGRTGDGRQGRLHRRAIAQHPPLTMTIAHFFAQRPHFAHQPGALVEAHEQGLDLFDAERLHQVIVRSLAHAFDR